MVGRQIICVMKNQQTRFTGEARLDGGVNEACSAEVTFEEHLNDARE